MSVQLNRKAPDLWGNESQNDKYIKDVNLLNTWYHFFNRGIPITTKRSYCLLMRKVLRHEKGRNNIYLPHSPFRTESIKGLSEDWTNGYVEGSWLEDIPINIDISKFARKDTKREDMPSLTRRHHIWVFPKVPEFRTMEEFNEWVDKRDIQTMVFRDVVGGLEASLTYNEGKLTRAVTKFGTDVFHVVRKISDIPDKINEVGVLEIRGKITLPDEHVIENDTTEFVTDLVTTDTGDKSLLTHLTFIAEDVMGLDALGTVESKVDFLSKEGFEVLPYYDLPNNKVWGMFKDRLEGRLTLPCKQTVKGMAIESYIIEDTVGLGYKGDVPQFKCLILFPDDSISVTIEHINWEIRNNGYYECNLVGKDKEIENVDTDTLQRFGIGKGSKVTMKPMLRNNEDMYSWEPNKDLYSIGSGKRVKTIPVITHLDNKNSTPTHLITDCKHCKTPLYNINGYMKCPAKYCKGRMLDGEVKHPVFKDGGFSICLIGDLSNVKMKMVRSSLKELGYNITKRHNKADLIVVLNDVDPRLTIIDRDEKLSVMDIKRNIYRNMSGVAKEHVVAIRDVVMGM